MTVSINGLPLETTGVVCRYGWDEVQAGTGVTMSTMTNLGNNFTLSVKDGEVVLVILRDVPEPASAV